MKKKFIYLFIFILFLAFIKDFSYAQDKLKIKANGIIQIHTNISDGKESAGEIIKKAKENNIKVIIFTDYFLRKWEYGIWPFRNLIKKKIEENSVIKFGIGKYINLIENLQKKDSSIIILPAVEVAPFYYWRGRPFSKSFGIYDTHKRFLVIDLEELGDLRLMPVVSNRHFKLNYIFFGTLKLWWSILLVILGFFLIMYQKLKKVTFKTLVITEHLHKFRKVGIIIVALGILFFINGFDFSTSRYGQYRGDLGSKPYQDFINYVNEKDALTFWVNPDFEYYSSYAGIDITTHAYPEMLQLTDGYAGFSVSFFNLLDLVEPKSKWDSVLLEYCKGKREKPTWVIGGLAYEGPQREIGAVKTVFLLSKLDKQSVLDALRNGKMYVEFKASESKFDFVNFYIQDTITEKNAIMGQLLDCQGNPKILINCTNPDYATSQIQIDLIKDGQLIKTFLSKDEKIEIQYEDSKPMEGTKCYYRLKITAPGKIIYTNPIFVL